MECGCLGRVCFRLLPSCESQIELGREYERFGSNSIRSQFGESGTRLGEDRRALVEETGGEQRLAPIGEHLDGSSAHRLVLGGRLGKQVERSYEVAAPSDEPREVVRHVGGSRSVVEPAIDVDRREVVALPNAERARVHMQGAAMVVQLGERVEMVRASVIGECLVERCERHVRQTGASENAAELHETFEAVLSVQAFERHAARRDSATSVAAVQHGRRR